LKMDSVMNRSRTMLSPPLVCSTIISLYSCPSIPSIPSPTCTRMSFSKSPVLSFLWMTVIFAMPSESSELMRSPYCASIIFWSDSEATLKLMSENRNILEYLRFSPRPPTRNIPSS